MENPIEVVPHGQGWALVQGPERAVIEEFSSLTQATERARDLVQDAGGQVIVHQAAGDWEGQPDAEAIDDYRTGIGNRTLPPTDR